MKFDFVKVGAFTPKIKVADTEFNADAMISGIEQAYDLGVEVLCFPEMCVCGYTVGDLVYSDLLLGGVEKALLKIEKFMLKKDMLVFVGAPIKKDNLIYDVAVAIDGSGIRAFIPKTDLLSYNDGYETRYFAPAKEENEIVIFESDGIKGEPKVIINDICGIENHKPEIII